MLLIYSAHITPRLEYICNQLFARIMGVAFQLTSQTQVFENSDAPKINYSNSPDLGGFQIKPTGLIEEKLLSSHQVNCTHWELMPIFFQTEQADLPFDIFSASFFLLSRYEEYHTTDHDLHHRFLHSSSLAYNNQFLERPLVDEWVVKLRSLLLQRFPHLQVVAPTFRFVPTIDLDDMFQFKYRGVWRSILGSIMAFFTAEYAAARKRLFVLSGMHEDPFDNLPFIINMHASLGLHPYFFLHFGGSGKFDKRSILPKKDYEAYANIPSTFHVGLHPSYWASHYPHLLQSEAERMHDYMNRRPVWSRFHYLRFKVPQSYQLLLQEGFTDDFTMGYSAALGFRASTSFPFNFYDLTAECSTSLLLHSPCVMDVTLLNSLKLTPEQAYDRTVELMQKVQAVGGEFISIFHNESLSTYPLWEGWTTMYSRILHLAVKIAK